MNEGDRSRAGKCCKYGAAFLVLGLFVPANAQETITNSRQVVTPIDQQRVAEAFLRDAETAGFKPIAEFPGTAEYKDEYSGDVPVFVPTALIADLRESVAPSEGVSRGLRSSKANIFFDDAGYFASVEFDDFMMSIEGTNISFTSEAADTQGSESQRSTPLEYYRAFSETYSGGAATFGFAGADYMVSFECKVGPDHGKDHSDDAKETEVSCIDAERAEQLIAQFVLCDSEARCIAADPRILRGEDQ